MRSKWLVLSLVLAVLGTTILSACGPATLEPTPQPTPSPDESEVLQAGPARARDAALTYLAAAYATQAPGTDLAWSQENVTREGLVGSSSLLYRAGNWQVAVTFPVVAPQATIYQVVVDDGATGFHWEGEVDADENVTETAGEASDVGVSPEAGQGNVYELAEGNSAFAFDLYQILSGQEGNLFYSPYSISAALAMTYAGAAGETEQQMAEALRFTLPQSLLHPAFKLLDLILAGRGQGAEGQDGEGFRLNIANALWGQEGAQFLASFLDVLADNYRAGLQFVDFAGDPEGARQIINGWVSDETEDRIEDLIPPGVLDAAIELVLTNAVYFNAAWAEPFTPEMTQDGAFKLLDGGEVVVPMMRQTASFAYASGEGYQAVELPYDGYELSMVILVPEAGGFEAFEDSLNAGQVEAMLEGLAYQQVALTMPPFEFESEFSLKDALASLGMPLAFTGDADFSGMTGSRDLFISEVLHKAYVSVDEEGTEAAAATAVMIAKSAAPSEPVEITIDRPFLFLIRDTATGSVLFVGRVLDPSS
ncbi:MAG: serpin family protein [Anaerolineae bacterium]